MIRPGEILPGSGLMAYNLARVRFVRSGVDRQNWRWRAVESSVRARFSAQGNPIRTVPVLTTVKVGCQRCYLVRIALTIP